MRVRLINVVMQFIANVGYFFPLLCQDMSRDVQFTVLNDRSQGGTSLTDGQLELMVIILIAAVYSHNIEYRIT